MGGCVLFERRLLFSMNLTIALCVFVSFGVAAETESYCEEQWSEIVSNVAREIPSNAVETKGILFAGSDGRIFNCLGQALPDSVVREQQFWTMSLSRAIASNPFEDEGPSC